MHLNYLLFSCSLQFTCDLPDIQPDKKNQITKEDRELFDISNNFFQICELLDEYEVISSKKKNLLCATTFVTDYN